MGADGQTLGDFAQEALDRRGLLYFQRVEEQARARLQAMTYPLRTAFAAAAAHRLLRAYQTRPADQQRPYVLSWGPVLGSVWQGLAGQQAAFGEVSAAIAEFYLSPHWHNDGPDGPREADDNTVAAISDAALCFLHGCTDFAVWAAGRAVDAAYDQAAELLGPVPPEAQARQFVAESAHPLVQVELQRQLQDLQLLSDEGRVLSGMGEADQDARRRLLAQLQR